MISINNSAEKRVFHLTKYEKEADFIQLKNEIIESIKNKNYSNLTILSKKTYAKQFSVFIFFNNSSAKGIVFPELYFAKRELL